MSFHIPIKKKVILVSSILLAMLFIIFGVMVLFVKYNKDVQHSRALLQSYADNLLIILAYEHERNEYSKETENLNELTINKLRLKINGYSYFKTGYAILFNASGESLIHPTIEGKNLSKTLYGSKILSDKKISDCFEYTDELTRSTKIIYYKYYKPKSAYIAIIVEKNDYMSDFFSFMIFFTTCWLLAFLIILYMIVKISSYFDNTISSVSQVFTEFECGNFNVHLPQKHFEARQINLKIKNFSSYINMIHKFAKELSEGNMNAQYQLNESKTVLPVYLNAIRNNIKTSKEAEELRKIEDEKMNWVNQGLAKFGELLRIHSNSLEDHCDNIIQNIVKYINANQGGLFLVNVNEQGEKTIDLVSSFAYDRKKFIKKSFLEGEGLIGTCFLEKQTVFVIDLPDNYIEITSGLGNATPRCVLICPIKNEDEVLGIVELASFNQFENHVIKFVEKILESVAATLKSAKINQETNELIRKFESQKKEMADNELMMKHTIEEFKATDEETQYKEAIFENFSKAITDSLIFVEYNESGFVTYANDNFINLIGKENKQLIQTTIKDHVHLRFAFIKDFNAFFDHMTSFRKYQTSNLYEIKDNKIWITDTYIPVKNGLGKLEKILRIITNNTSMALLEEQHNELKKQLESLTKEKNELLKKLNN